MIRPETETLTVAVGAGVATVTMNRPEVRNVLNRRAYAEVEAVFQRIQSEAEAPAGRIAANAPLAARYLKDCLRRASAGKVNEFGSWVSGTLARLFQTEDHKEGVARFLEKRLPVFRGS